MTLRKGK